MRKGYIVFVVEKKNCNAHFFPSSTIASAATLFPAYEAAAVVCKELLSSGDYLYAGICDPEGNPYSKEEDSSAKQHIRMEDFRGEFL